MAQSPVAVVGGTGGIGAGIAKALGSYWGANSKPVVHIIGRSKEGADAVISALKESSPQGNYTFHPCDVTLLSNVRQVTAKLSEIAPKINFLALTCGILTMQGRTETKEGNDVKMMLHYYSRMAFIKDLLPNLQKAADSNEPARVLTVLDAKRGNTKSLYLDDLDLRRNYSTRSAGTHCITMTDAAVYHLASQNPKISFIHAYPGMVKTDLLSKQPFYLRIPLGGIAAALATSVDVCASNMLKAFSSSEFATGAHFINSKGAPVSGKETISPELQQKIWTHTEGIIRS